MSRNFLHPEFTLLSAAAATGTGVVIPPGMYVLEISGSNFDGATATLQKLRIGGAAGTAGDWISDAAAVATGNEIWRDLALSSGTYRILIETAGGSTSVSANLARVP